MMNHSGKFQRGIASTPELLSIDPAVGLRFALEESGPTDRPAGAKRKPTLGLAKAEVGGKTPLVIAAPFQVKPTANEAKDPSRSYAPEVEECPLTMDFDDRRSAGCRAANGRFAIRHNRNSEVAG